MALVKNNLNGNAVEYDDSEFEILTNGYNEKYLHYIGSGQNVHNPKGNISCFAMFEDFEGTSLDLSNFNTHNITNMSYMFFYCQNLKFLNLGNFNTKNVVDMSGMFSECRNLKELNISQLNTESVLNMEDMFNKCKNLTELDISSFHINITTRLSDMFWGCINLEKIKVSSDYLDFFTNNKKSLFKKYENINIIPVTKTDRIIKELFY